MDLVHTGFILSLAAILSYWSMALDDGVINRKPRRIEIVLFGSLGRVAVFQSTISLTIGFIGVIIDSSQLVPYLLLNLIALPIVLMLYASLVKSVRAEEQIALWKYDYTGSVESLDELCNAIETLVRELRVPQLVRYFTSYLSLNPKRLEFVRSCLSRLEQKHIVPLDLTTSILSLLKQDAMKERAEEP